MFENFETAVCYDKQRGKQSVTACFTQVSFFSVMCGKYLIVYRMIAIYLHLSILALANALVSFYSHVNV